MSPDPYRYFRVEARELIDQLGKTVLELEKAPSAELVARLLRVAHTLKGAARVVKQPAIAERAHALEDAVSAFRGAPAPLARDRVDALLALVDDMNGLVAALGASDTAARRPAPEAEAKQVAPATVGDVPELDELLDGVTELHAQLTPVRRALDEVERAQRLAELVVDQLASPREHERVDAKARSMAEELRGVLGALERTLSSGIDLVDRELTQVRRSAEQLRLTPASVMFTSLERAARDAAGTLGRSVAFEGRGGDVRLDGPVLAAVQNALVQVVRNAVAHGIEPEAERLAAGKRGTGRVTVDVARRGRRVAFVATDDGRGVDVEAVRRAAQRRGLTPDAARSLGAGELLRLLLAGGVSTAASVTEIAGRGVGLDVVRETVERFGGEVRVSTEPRAGTTVELLVPVSVASLQGLMVEAGGVTATIPLDAVARTTRVRAAEVAVTAAGESVMDEGKVLPFVPLASTLSVRRAAARPPAWWAAVVVRGASGAAVVGVDRLLGTQHVVLRPLPRLAPAAPVVAGASLDAEGDPLLVLDPDALVLAARRVGREERAPAAAPKPILVIDDSLTTRMLERSILESAGYEVDVAASAEEGLDKARAGRFALFLVDIEMPGMDGFAFVERTRADPLLRSIPAILVSSRSSPDDLRRGREVGALDYVVKSEFDQVALLARIREQVG
ncbi:MAG: response regulator [Polyangiaceae bacterium]|jgi:two-component system chemotaxis sensor kinase CheA